MLGPDLPQSESELLRRSRGKYLGLVTTLFLACAFLRFHQLDTTPSGLLVDVAFNGMDVRDILSGHFSVFFPRNGGREPLFIYFQAFLVGFGGMHPMVFEFASVSMGMVTVSLAYRLGKAMLNREIALLSAGLLGLSLWAVTMSRLGLRTSSLPPFLLAGSYCLLRVFRAGRMRYAILGGCAFGLSLYTYRSAWFVPLVTLLACLFVFPLAIKRWRQLAVMAGLAFAVFVPECLYFMSNSAEALRRNGEVSIFGSSSGGLFSNLSRTAQMFFLRGDPNPALNFSDLPVFNPLLGLCFVVGLIVAVKESPVRWSCSYLIAWLVVMLAPVALSIDAPNSLRGLAAAPSVFLIAAIGTEAVFRFFKLAGSIRAVLTCALLLAQALTTYGIYFGPWARDPRTANAYDYAWWRAVDSAAVNDAQQVFIADSDMADYIIRVFDPSSAAHVWQPPESDAVPILDQATGPTLYMSVRSAALTGNIASWLPGVEVVSQIKNEHGGPELTVFRWSREANRQFQESLKTVVSPSSAEFVLTGYKALSTSTGAALDLVWHQDHPSGAYDLFVHLLDSDGRQVSQSDRLVWSEKKLNGVMHGEPDRRGYFDDGMTTSDTVVTQHSFSGLPPGSYTAEIGVARRDPLDESRVLGGSLGQVVRLPVTLR